LEIFVPPLSEQKRIVETIDGLVAKVNDARQRLSRVRDILKRFRQCVLASACSGRLTEDWRDAASPSEVATILVDKIRHARAARGQAAALPVGADDLPDSSLPGTWTWCRVGDIAQVCLGGTPSRRIASYWGGEIAWVSSSEVANCRISTTRETITPAGRDNSNAKAYPPGTVLIAMIGEGKTRGQAAILDIAACTNQNAAGLVFESSTVSPEYVWYWALGEYEKNRSLGRGGNYPALNCAKVRALPIPLPPRREQREIVRCVGALFAIADAIEHRVAAAVARAMALPQAILAKAFQGELMATAAEGPRAT
jgi:type I restriction enzyme S subunit